ncbi:MAG: alkaline phosphatase family protein [Candidatus Aminicenantes bacterium]|nr:alkaline phosphatase family protein [Candidatus Aminicenantes bacterium]
MKFLKVLLNALVGGLFSTALLVLLLYDLNINLSFRPLAAARLLLPLGLSYGLVVAAVLVIVFFLVQFFSGRDFRIRVVSPTFLSLSFAVLSLLFLLVLRENVRYFKALFDPAARRALGLQTAVLVVQAVLAFVFVYLDHRRGKKGIWLIPALLIFAVGFLVAVGARTRLTRPVPPEPTSLMTARPVIRRATVLGLEGLSLDFFFPLVAEAKIPNFSWLIENGSWGRLGSFAPNESFVLNTSLATGKLPFRHRSVSAVSFILPEAPDGLEVLPRYILFRQLTRLGLLSAVPKVEDPQAMTVAEIVAANAASTADWGWPLECDPQPEPRPEARADKTLQLVLPGEGALVDQRLAVVRAAVQCDQRREERAFAGRTPAPPAYFHLLIGGLNNVQATFYKYSFPSAFGMIDQDDINRYGSVIERYYTFYDQLVGKYLASLKDDELLVVYSPFGVEPLPLWKRVVEWILGNPEISAYHENAPDGVVFFYGQGVRKGNNIEGVRLIDLAPTVLYYLGLPVGRDMDGVVQSSLFQPEFTAENPVLSISSYEEVRIVPPR